MWDFQSSTADVAWGNYDLFLKIIKLDLSHNEEFLLLHSTECVEVMWEGVKSCNNNKYIWYNNLKLYVY